MLKSFNDCAFYRASQSVVFISSQKMALRAFYFIRTLTKALAYYYINRSQRHLLATVENNRLGGPIPWPATHFFESWFWTSLQYNLFNLIIIFKGTRRVNQISSLTLQKKINFPFLKKQWFRYKYRFTENMSVH